MNSPHHDRTHVKFSCLNIGCKSRYPLYVLPQIAEQEYHCADCGWRMVSGVKQDVADLLEELGLTGLGN
jgi:PHP family Zn ribbon phosphoesterase